MRVLITGGAGFIGSHLAERFLEEGADVRILDDLSTGSMENVEHLTDHERFHHRIGSVTDEPLVAELVDGADLTVHLAAAVGVRLIVDQPVRTIETNVHGTQTVLDCVAEKGTPVVVASTSEVYGKRRDVPFRESDDLVLGPTTHSRWSYACSKALDEWLALAYHRERGVPALVVRLFNAVGPRQTGRYGMVIPTFVRQALAGDPITVYGTGEQTRSFAHVRDVVEALVRLISRRESFGEVFNVGSDREVSINRLARIVRDVTGSSSPIERIPYDEAYAEGFEDMQRRVPDLSKLEDAVGFKPSTPLEEIVQDVAASRASPRIGAV